MPNDRWSSDSIEEFKRYLEGVTILDGEGTIWVNSHTDKVYIAIIHDSSGFNPGAAIVASDISEQDALEAAYDVLRLKYLEDEDYVKEIQDEWEDEWEEILTEAFDGKVFTLDPAEAAEVIKNDKWVSKYIDIDYEEEDYE